MHGRLWLAPLFALVLPVAVVPVPAHGLGRAVTAIASLGLAGWAVVCAAGLRPPYSGNLMPFDATTQIQDERAFELRHADGTSNPVAADDFPKLAQVGREMRARAEAGEDVFVTFAPGWQDQTPLAAGRGTWVAEPMAGIMPAVAGPRVSIFDYYGIVDPIAARVRVEGDPTRPLRPGHLKSLDAAWGVAVATWPDTVPGDRASQLAHCRPIDELMHAVRDPMTPSRFAQNVLAAPRLTSLRFPADPNEAARELCPSGEREGPEPDRSAVTSPAPTVPRLSPSTCIDVTLALADLSDPEPSAAVERSAAQLRDRLPEDLRADVDEAVRARGVDEARRETSIARITSWVNAAC